MVRIDEEKAIIIGGKSGSASYESSLYLLKSFDGNLEFSKLNKSLTYARAFFVAIPLPDEAEC